MRETIIVNVKGAELPAEWREQAGLAPGERVDVVIRASRTGAMRDLVGIADRVSKSARRKGMTRRKLDRLLSEAKAARRR